MVGGVATSTLAKVSLHLLSVHAKPSSLKSITTGWKHILTRSPTGKVSGRRTWIFMAHPRSQHQRWHPQETSLLHQRILRASCWPMRTIRAAPSRGLASASWRPWRQAPKMLLMACAQTRPLPRRFQQRQRSRTVLHSCLRRYRASSAFFCRRVPRK